MREFEKRPDKFLAIQIIEENEEELQTLPWLRSLGYGIFVFGENVLPEGSWLVVESPSEAVSHYLDEQFRSTFKEIEQ